MIGCLVQGFKRACTDITGVIDVLLVADANDFEFTSGPLDTKGNPTGYASVGLRTGATALGGGSFFEIESLVDSKSLDISQANADGRGSSYDYTILATAAQINQDMANFASKLDAASYCCQLLFVVRTSGNKILVMGEKYVDGSSATRFIVRQDGSKFNLGKKLTDASGSDISLKGIYSRLPYEFTGGWAAIETFIAA